MPNQPSPCGIEGHTLSENGLPCERCQKHCILETPRERAEARSKTDGDRCGRCETTRVVHQYPAQRIPPTCEAFVEPLDQGAIEVTAQGGKHSASPYFLRGLPPRAILRVARILRDGALKYEADPFGDVSKRNWLLISSDAHLEHLMTHAVQYLAGDDAEDHASHIATRALFFLHQYLAEHPEFVP